MRTRIERGAAPDIHRIEDAGVNWYLVEAGSGLIVVDALVMLDPYTGERGPRIVAGAATADSERALRSLDALVVLDAGTVLTGHGEPWRGGTAEAVTLARAVGPS